MEDWIDNLFAQRLARALRRGERDAFAIISHFQQTNRHPQRRSRWRLEPVLGSRSLLSFFDFDSDQACRSLASYSPFDVKIDTKDRGNLLLTMLSSRS